MHLWLAALSTFTRFALAILRSRTALAAENLFLRKQLAFYHERKQKTRRTDDATRFTMALLSRFFDWSDALLVVRPETLIRWQRSAARLYWKWKSRPGRPKLPVEIRQFIRLASRDNPTWGQERIRDEILVKFGLRVSARTVRKYMLRRDSGPRKPGSQSWAAFIRNHASAVIAADFLNVVTARFQILFVLVVMDVPSRRMLHVNVTAHPTWAWTTQQFREAIPCEHPYRFVVLDRDILFSTDVRDKIERLGVEVLQTPPRAPQANAFCERLIGTIRRECLDLLIPLSENHVRKTLLEFRDFYNRSRPHASLGPGVPEPADGLPAEPSEHRHKLPEGARIVSKPVLGGLHHDYRLVRDAA